MLAIILLNIIYGSTFTISKILLQFAPPLYLIGIRMTLAGTLLLSYARFFRKERFVYSKEMIKSLALIGSIGIFLPYVLRYYALGYMTVGKTALIYNLSPFVSFIFSVLLLSERITWKKLLGVTIGFCGIVPSIMVQSASEANLDIFWKISWPELAMIVSVSAFCFGWIIMKQLVGWTTRSAFWINGHTMLLGGIMSLSTSWFMEPYATIAEPLQFGCWLALIMILTNVITYQLYAHLLKTTSATLMSLGSLIAPISASATSWLYFKEAIGWDFFATLGIVLFGFVIFYQDEFK